MDEERSIKWNEILKSSVQRLSNDSTTSIASVDTSPVCVYGGWCRYYMTDRCRTCVCSKETEDKQSYYKSTLLKEKEDILMHLDIKSAPVYCLLRGHKDKMSNIRSEILSYAYTTDTNELFMVQNNTTIKLNNYEDFNPLLLNHLSVSVAYLHSELPARCSRGQLFVCIDTKEIYIGDNDMKPRLVLSSKYKQGDE